MTTAAPAQMTMELPIAMTMDEPETETVGKSHITSVQILTLDAPWWETAIKPTQEYKIVAVFRNHSRLYRSYEYRPGLRHMRAVRIAGRW